MKRRLKNTHCSLERSKGSLPTNVETLKKRSMSTSSQHYGHGQIHFFSVEKHCVELLMLMPALLTVVN